MAPIGHVCNHGFEIRKRAEVLRGFTFLPTVSGFAPSSRSTHKPFLLTSWKGPPPLPVTQSSALPYPAVGHAIRGLFKSCILSKKRRLRKDSGSCPAASEIQG